MKLSRIFIVITLLLIILSSAIRASRPADSSINLCYKPQQKNIELVEAIKESFSKNELKNIFPKKESDKLLLAENKKNEDLTHLKAAEKLIPNDYSIKIKLGNIYEDLGQNSKAFAQYYKASFASNHKIRNDSKKALSNLSSLDIYYEYQKKDPKLAKVNLQLFIEKNPRNVIAQKEMGNFLLNEKKEKEALPHFLVAEKLAPKDYSVKSQLGYIYQDLGEPGKAYIKFNEAQSSPEKKIRLETKNAMVDLINMDTYYSLKKTHPILAKNILQ